VVSRQKKSQNQNSVQSAAAKTCPVHFFAISAERNINLLIKYQVEITDYHQEAT
jgi:hypothetical protein